MDKEKGNGKENEEGVKDVMLAVGVSLHNLNDVLSSLQADGMVIETITPITLQGITRVLVAFRSGSKWLTDPYDLLVWLEEEYQDKVIIY